MLLGQYTSNSSTPWIFFHDSLVIKKEEKKTSIIISENIEKYREGNGQTKNASRFICSKLKSHMETQKTRPHLQPGDLFSKLLLLLGQGGLVELGVGLHDAVLRSQDWQHLMEVKILTGERSITNTDGT